MIFKDFEIAWKFFCGVCASEKAEGEIANFFLDTLPPQATSPQAIFNYICDVRLEFIDNHPECKFSRPIRFSSDGKGWRCSFEQPNYKVEIFEQSDKWEVVPSEWRNGTFFPMQENHPALMGGILALLKK